MIHSSNAIRCQYQQFMKAFHVIPCFIHLVKCIQYFDLNDDDDDDIRYKPIYNHSKQMNSKTIAMVSGNETNLIDN